MSATEESEEKRIERELEASAEKLGLQLEPAERWPPWGFVQVAVHGAGAYEEVVPEEEEGKIRAVIREYENLDPELDDEALEKLKEITTDPFVCVEDATTYDVEHAVLSELREISRQRMRARGFEVSGGPIEIFYSSIWHVSPVVASVSYTARQAGVDGKVTAGVLLRREEGVWRLNVIALHKSE